MIEMVKWWWWCGNADDYGDKCGLSKSACLHPCWLTALTAASRLQADSAWSHGSPTADICCFFFWKKCNLNQFESRLHSIQSFPWKCCKGSLKKNKKNILMDLVQLTRKPPPLPPPPQMWTMFFFSPLFYSSFPIFIHIFYIKSKKNTWKVDSDRNHPPPPLWIKSIKMFFCFFLNFPNGLAWCKKRDGEGEGRREGEPAQVWGFDTIQSTNYNLHYISSQEMWWKPDLPKLPKNVLRLLHAGHEQSVCGLGGKGVSRVCYSYFS